MKQMAFHFSNNEFEYVLAAPEGAEAEWVDFYCEVRFNPVTGKPFKREILPFPGAELTYYFSGGAGIESEDPPIPIQPGAYFFGQPTATRIFSIVPGTRIFFIRLKQYLLKSLFHTTRPWRDTIFDPSEIFPAMLIPPHGELEQAKGFEERMAIASACLLRLKAILPDENYTWLRSLEALLEKDLSVSGMAEGSFLGPRQFERRFQSYFDLSPRSWLRLKKLSAALDHYARHADTSVTDASYEGKFADQAHFIKTFRLFARQAPLRFFRDYGLKKK